MMRFVVPTITVILAVWSIGCELVPIEDVQPDKCKGGCPPVVTPHCVEWEALDPSGKPLQNVYAVNVDSYEAGKKLLAQQGTFQNETISAGTCGEQPTICPKYYAPICGASRDETRTYGNVCEFKVAVRKEAGKSDQSKGHWDVGACKTPYCVEFETADPEGNPERNFYAFNVNSEAEAKDILGTYPQAIESAVNPGTCAQQSQMCPLYLLYAPVCGETAEGTKTFNSLCEFKIAIRTQAGDDDASKGHYELGQCDEQPQPVDFKTVTQGSYSGFGAQLETSITDQEKFLDLWKQHTSNVFPAPPAPVVDFGEEMVIAVFTGIKTSGGYGVAITQIQTVGQELRVHYSTTSPGPGCIVTLALTQPHHIVRLPRSDKAVVFVATHTVTQCN